MFFPVLALDERERQRSRRRRDGPQQLREPVLGRRLDDDLAVDRYEFVRGLNLSTADALPRDALDDDEAPPLLAVPS